jgi:hypothetical protein
MYPSGGPPSKASAKPELSLEITEPARGVIVLEKGELLKLTMNPIATFPQHLPFPT